MMQTETQISLCRQSDVRSCAVCEREENVLVSFSQMKTADLIFHSSFFFADPLFVSLRVSQVGSGWIPSALQNNHHNLYVGAQSRSLTEIPPESSPSKWFRFILSCITYCPTVFRNIVCNKVKAHFFSAYQSHQCEFQHRLIEVSLGRLLSPVTEKQRQIFEMTAEQRLKIRKENVDLHGKCQQN